jgi:hypothetical protein
MAVSIQHLHTYFFFPFSVDKETVSAEHAEHWKKHAYWIGGLDEWIAWHATNAQSPVAMRLGCWQRAAYTRADMESPAYQDMVFFHPYVRRVFFDISDKVEAAGEREALIRCYRIPLDADRRVWLAAGDARGRSARAQVTDLRLFLFANGMGILSIGVEARNISAKEALWFNEQARKIYPSSGRQVREGRGPNYLLLSVGAAGAEAAVAEEKFDACSMIGFQPPLSKIIQSLLYFLDYAKHEYEQLLDERMIVYSYVSVDPSTLPAGFAQSEEYQHFLSRLLYVDHDGGSFRYEPEFTRAQMQRHLYTRWAHEGTYYGFTSYSNVSCTIGVHDLGEHQAKEGFLIHRMFDSRYYLMAIIALFYRATLLDFAQKTALVARGLYHDQQEGEFSAANVQYARALRAEFLHFSNHWFFEELANKDEEIEHFDMQCQAYRIFAMKKEVENEIAEMNQSLREHAQSQSTEAVNRLAMVSMILGAGAVVTGFFGMNFGREFGTLLFEPEGQPTWLHYGSIVFVTLFALGAVAFGGYLVFSNPADYKDILVPTRKPTRRKWFSFKRLLKG